MNKEICILIFLSLLLLSSVSSTSGAKIIVNNQKGIMQPQNALDIEVQNDVEGKRVDYDKVIINDQKIFYLDNNYTTVTLRFMYLDDSGSWKEIYTCTLIPDMLCNFNYYGINYNFLEGEKVYKGERVFYWKTQ